MKRNYGIDILRLLAMFFVACLHILGQGGVLGGSEALSVHYGLGWLLEAMAFCAVNCFGLISGYVGVNSRQKFSNLAVLLFQVCFYTLLWTLLSPLISGESLTATAFLKGCWPQGKYWYFDSYFIMFFLIPAMNYVLRRLNPTLLKLMIAGAVAVCYFLPTNGYNFVWLSGLYLLGGSVSLLEEKREKSAVSGKWSVTLYFSAVLVAWLVKIGVELAAIRSGSDIPDASYLIRNTSPAMLLAALALLRYFAHCPTSDKVNAVVKRLSPLAFGVYLAHTEPRAFRLLKDRFVWMGELPAPLLPFAVLAAALLLWAVCLAVDALRLWIFNKCRIPQSCKKVEAKITGYCSCLFSKTRVS